MLQSQAQIKRNLNSIEERSKFEANNSTIKMDKIMLSNTNDPKEFINYIKDENNTYIMPTFGNNSDRITEEDIEESEESHSRNRLYQESNSSSGPLLFIDVNIVPNRTERIIVYEEDTAEQLAEDFAKKHNLNKYMKQKLFELLNMEMTGILDKIEEEKSEYLSDDF